MSALSRNGRNISSILITWYSKKSWNFCPGIFWHENSESKIPGLIYHHLTNCCCYLIYVNSMNLFSEEKVFKVSGLLSGSVRDLLSSNPLPGFIPMVKFWFPFHPLCIKLINKSNQQTEFVLFSWNTSLKLIFMFVYNACY